MPPFSLKKSSLLLFLLLAPASFVMAEDPVEGRAQEDPAQEQLYSDVKKRLESDEEAREALARRIARSTLGTKISAAPDESSRLDEIREWIKYDPQSAAYLAVGLAQDEADGAQKYEKWLNRNVSARLEPNPEAQKGIFGRLKKSNLDSKLMRQDSEMTDEERNEILKTLFEGQGGQSNKILTQKEKGPGLPPETGSAAAPLNAGYYDRLSRGNLHGYSPELQAMQSALNLSRAPGAPKLVETGKLDYETLSHPVYGMRFDIRNLETRLRYERNFGLAKRLGRHKEFTAQQLLSDEVEAQLKASAGKPKSHPRFQKRQAALEKAALAERAFEAAARAGKDKLKITPWLLAELSAKQKEAARWITAASIEEELQRMESEEKFLSPELLALIEKAPVDLGARSAYRRRGEEFRKKLLVVKANDEDALKALESDGWMSALVSINALLAHNSVLRKNLSRNIQNFMETPYRLAYHEAPQSWWRRLLDFLAERFSSNGRAKALKQEERDQELLKDVFLKIARGDMDAAHGILASTRP